MAYTALTWTAATRVSAQNLNNLETQYDEVMADVATWNDHSARYYSKTTVLTTFYNSTFMGNGSGADADLLDGHEGSELFGTGLPTGSIIWWWKNIADLPAGWYECNGANGTTDYREHFIICTGTYHANKTHYGSNTVTPTTASTSIGAHALTTAELPAHTHTYTEYYATNVTNWYYGPGMSYYCSRYTANPTEARTTTATGGGSTHTHTGSTITWNSESNIPPYVVMYLVQKVS